MDCGRACTVAASAAVFVDRDLCAPIGQARSWARRRRQRNPCARVLIRKRLSRIYFRGRFFDYPEGDFETRSRSDCGRSARFGAVCVVMLLPRRPAQPRGFLHTVSAPPSSVLQGIHEKVLGTPCSQTARNGRAGGKASRSPKPLHAISGRFAAAVLAPRSRPPHRSFLYPKYGPGLMWETTVEKLRARGVRFEFESPVSRIEQGDGRIRAVQVRRPDGAAQRYEADSFISTMPVRDLVLGLAPDAPQAPREIAAGLEYRDFITVGLLYRKLMRNPVGSGPMNIVPDNWIYIQESGVKVGRLQIFNNWSPYLVRDPETVWIGMEYFCREGDDLWSMPDAELQKLGVAEMRRLNLAEPADHLDGVVIRMPKAYPGYYGTYGRFEELRRYLDAFPNLFLVGRKMHPTTTGTRCSLRKRVDASWQAAATREDMGVKSTRYTRGRNLCPTRHDGNQSMARESGHREESQDRTFFSATAANPFLLARRACLSASPATTRNGGGKTSSIIP